MKKYISLVLITFLFMTVLVVPANASTNIGYIPINYEYWFTTNSIGTPVMNIFVVNNTDKKIVSFETIIYPKDAYGRSIKAYGFGDTYERHIASDVTLDEKFDSWGGDATLYGYDAAVASTSVLQIESVKFADGSVWTNTGYNYTEANFYITNDTDPSGAYIVDPKTHEIDLIEIGYSAQKRDWYIWNDGVGWVWFSNAMAPTCTVWTSSASIKLVINNNPNLYKVINFTVKESPYFQILSHQKYELSMSNTSSGKTYYSATIPFDCSLWDMSDPSYSRSWYILNPTTNQWIWFSNERGPSCTIWTRGKNAIKLVHNGDFDNAAIYEFYLY